QALRKNGHHVEIFTSGIEAMKRLVEKKFDIVVTDIRMDEIDGIEVMTRVMKLYPSTKVIIITGYATIETAREALAKGAFDFIAKPFRPNDLRTIIEKAIKAKH
ncbi:MAG TPA: response regulator, partial [Bacteroidetes bacterium]|nr:response regulator [Bacteroidota bacterium]HEX03828.1 response regulator [Bacteroidota bacterium]